MTDHRPILRLERNNAGRLFLGVTELDGRGPYVLSMQDGHTVDSVMRRRYEDMARLMGDNVKCEPAVSHQEEV